MQIKFHSIHYLSFVLFLTSISISIFNYVVIIMVVTSEYYKTIIITVEEARV